MKKKLPKFQVAVVGARFGALTIEDEILSPIGCKIIEGIGKNDRELIKLCKVADAIIVGSICDLTRPVIDSLSNCKIISRAGVGTDNIDKISAKKKGIVVTYVPDYCIDEVSDHAMSFILHFARKLHTAKAEVSTGNWGIANLRPIYPLKSSILGILGIGRIGAALAKKATAFGMKLVAFDPFANDSIFKKLNAQKLTLQQLLKKSDYLSLHAPYTKKTKEIIQGKTLSLMKKNAILINVARGELINERDLYSSLKKREIRAAALDVLTEEPPKKTNKLLTLDNCIITPHSAWYSTNAQKELRQKAAEEVKRVLMKRKPKNQIA
ncbi:MAG: C-terminal binding protein [Nitrospinota bacterium]|nr:C-terminal binding protein [Nitrospinota bacterium]